MMLGLDQAVAGCGVVVDPDAPDGFDHLATAWQIAPGEWISAWDEAFDERSASFQLLTVRGGERVAIGGLERQGTVVGFRAEAAADVLATEAESAQPALGKRMPLMVVGYPSVIDHPAFRLHRGSLTAERYLPYLCPWRVNGHCALFTLESGWVTGAVYAGMQGAPVFAGEGRVVGVVIADATVGEPPLTAFARVN